MVKKQLVLASWVGGNDLKAVAGAEAGPILATLNTVAVDKVELLCSYPAERVEPYLAWLRQQVDVSIGHGESLGLQPKTLGSADALPGRWNCAHRQQPGRKPDPALGPGALELVVCRVATQRQTRGGDHEPYPVGPHERA